MAALTDMHERQVNVAPAGTWSLERFAAGKLSGGPSQRTWKESSRFFSAVNSTRRKTEPRLGKRSRVSDTLILCLGCIRRRFRRAAKYAECLKRQFCVAADCSMTKAALLKAVNY